MCKEYPSPFAQRRLYLVLLKMCPKVPVPNGHILKQNTVDSKIELWSFVNEREASDAFVAALKGGRVAFAQRGKALNGRCECIRSLAASINERIPRLQRRGILE